MQCSRCGFVMSELDTDCLRCRRLGVETQEMKAAPAAAVPSVAVQEKECPRCGKATGMDALRCDKCGYEYDPDSSRAERYQALVAQEATLPAPSALRRTVPVPVAWGIIAACLLVIGGAGWGMFGGSLTGSSAEAVMDSAIITSHHHKRRLAAGLQSVTYSVTGTAAMARISYLAANAVPVALPIPVTLPWTETITAKTGSHLSLSAGPSGPTGTVAVSIEAEGTVRKQASTPGADGLTTAAATL